MGPLSRGCNSVQHGLPRSTPFWMPCQPFDRRCRASRPPSSYIAVACRPDRAPRVAGARKPCPGPDVRRGRRIRRRRRPAVGVWRNRPDRRLPWILMAAGQASFVAGDLMWNYFEVIGEEPFPSFADVLYLGGYPFIALGLFLLIRRRLGDGDRGGMLDAAILTTGVAVLSWTFLMRPVVADTELDLLSMAISLAYPIGGHDPARRRDGPADDSGSAGPPHSRCSAPASPSLVVADIIYALQTLEGTYVSREPHRHPVPRRLRAVRCFCAPSIDAPADRSTPSRVTWLGPIRLVCLAAAMLTGPALLAMGPDAGTGLAVVAIGTALALPPCPCPARRACRSAGA